MFIDVYDRRCIQDVKAYIIQCIYKYMQVYILYTIYLLLSAYTCRCPLFHPPPLAHAETVALLARMTG